MLFSVVRLLAMIFCAHFPFWVIYALFYSQLPLLNYDFFLSVGLMVLSPRIGVGLLLTAYTTTLLIVSSAIYRFKSWIYFLDNWNEAIRIDWASFLSLNSILMLLVIVSGLYGSFFFAKHLRFKPQLRIRLILFCLTLFGCTVAADSLNGSSDYFTRSSTFFPVNIGGSSLYIAQKQMRAEITVSDSLKNLSTQETLGGHFDIFKHALAHPKQSVLIVAVESLGMPEDPDLREWLVSQVQKMDSYKIIGLEIPFKGSTTNAELRHLCNIDGSYKGITSQTFSCLPFMLQKIGWNTLGFHGYTSTMFDRARWWPLIGIKETQFLDSSGLHDLPRCGGMFNGICDDVLIARAFESTQEPRTLTYLLTLDTHLPIKRKRVLNDELQNLCNAASVSMEVCVHIDALGRVLASIAYQADSLHSINKPLVVIFGDHAPPFVIIKDRLAFNQTHVPAFILLNAQ